MKCIKNVIIRIRIYFKIVFKNMEGECYSCVFNLNYFIMLKRL